mmetsp:Transcript_2895/g.11163  ORF Transcript_2895/g.11163 Transcript_2895/m.11163 type:complete len:219 (+) Transcript_2895:2030-2686(+)
MTSFGFNSDATATSSLPAAATDAANSGGCSPISSDKSANDCVRASSKSSSNSSDSLSSAKTRLASFTFGESTACARLSVISRARLSTSFIAQALLRHARNHSRSTREPNRTSSTLSILKLAPSSESLARRSKSSSMRRTNAFASGSGDIAMSCADLLRLCGCGETLSFLPPPSLMYDISCEKSIAATGDMSTVCGVRRVESGAKTRNTSSPSTFVAID